MSSPPIGGIVAETLTGSLFPAKDVLDASGAEGIRSPHYMKCPQCRRHVPDDAEFCPKCGVKLSLACAECGTPNEAAHRFCRKCGQALREASRPSRITPLGTGFPVVAQNNGGVERGNDVDSRRHECRSCGSTAVERDLSATRFERLVLPLIGRRLYVCRDCQARFYDRPIHYPDW